MTKTIPLLTLALGLTLGLGGCETVSDAAGSVGDTVGSAASSVASALDPTSWFGGDSSTPAPDAGTQTASSDTEARTSPDLASLPARPATSTPAQQQAAAQSLAADGAQARYSADSLRAGTEAAAAPPAATADVPVAARLALNAPPSANDAPPSASDIPPSASDAPPTTDAPPSAQPVAAAPAARPAAPAAMAPAPPAALAQGTAAVPTSGRPAPVQTAAAAPTRAPGAEPAVPAVPPSTPVRGAVGRSQVMTDAALGFKPSAAPPLDPSINQWVSAPIVARYRQTASNAGISPVRTPAVPAKGVSDLAGGAVVANLDAVSTGPTGAVMGAAPTAVVFFPGDGITLSAAARTQIKNAVAQYKSTGGAVRVVGHASSRTANMPVEKHLETIFEKSQQRANAVAQELIHEGVPADRVLIEAVGDSQPVYYESMPQGEEGNRRAEIFVQG